MATIRWCPIFPKWDSYQPLYTVLLLIISHMVWIVMIHYPWRIHGAAIYMLTWLGYIDGIHVTIYSIHGSYGLWESLLPAPTSTRKWPRLSNMFFRLSALTHALVDAHEETRVLVGHEGCMKIYGKTPNPLLSRLMNIWVCLKIGYIPNKIAI